MSIVDFPEMLCQRILAGILLVGRLGGLRETARPRRPARSRPLPRAPGACRRSPPSTIILLLVLLLIQLFTLLFLLLRARGVPPQSTLYYEMTLVWNSRLGLGTAVSRTETQDFRASTRGQVLLTRGEVPRDKQGVPQNLA